MSLHIIEIEGKVVMAFPARDEIEALQFADSGPTQEDLAVLHHNGAPLWNGKDALFVRVAHPEEEAGWEAAFARALHAGDADPEDRDDWVVFLVPVSDPTDYGLLDDDEEEEEEDPNGQS